MIAFAREMLLCVRGGDDGDVATKGGFDVLVKVVASGGISCVELGVLEREGGVGGKEARDVRVVV